METFFRDVYGGVDDDIRGAIIERTGPKLENHVRQVEECGITKVSGLFPPEQVLRMQEDVAKWRDEKQWNIDRHMGFDGNSGEAYLPTSESLSLAVTHPAITVIAGGTFGQHPSMNFVRTYSIDPIEPYERRAFKWHHDGYSEVGLKAMILISDVPEGGQAMVFAPGTNKRTWDTSTSRETQFDTDYAESFALYECSGKAGDVFIFNPNALHKGTRNMTERRDVIVANFQPGIARNYPLPGLHPSVVDALSEYQRFVFRVGNAKSSPTEEAFEEELYTFRATMASAFEEWDLPDEVIRMGLRNSVDTRIDQAARINEATDPQGSPYAEKITQDDVFRFQTQIDERRAGFADFISSDHGAQTVDSIKARANSEIQADLHADLDLPVRMYHPDRDQRRDNAITQTRDPEDGDHVAALEHDLTGVSVHDIETVDLNGYTTAISTLLSIHKDYVGASDLAQKTDSLFCLAEDLQEMLGRAYSVPLIRRTLLYTYLTWANAERMYDQANASEVDLLEALLAGRKESIKLYSAFVAFDSYLRIVKPI